MYETVSTREINLKLVSRQGMKGNRTDQQTEFLRLARHPTVQLSSAPMSPITRIPKTGCQVTLGTRPFRRKCFNKGRLRR